ncbi:hypothetical protein LSH36_294g03029 [Paralvinella palmiformis]|uniref:G-protein coupled receptors family 1 profile domain-containing protein n=1 Tax=Paralvinella palmiformis TaxID=53620 RepID=A0AAD9JIW1_9ANNE|nr:hypothetical protein LSH36_294g03029 [Paralvinella palmiformis]
MNDNNRSSVKVRMNENNLTEITNGSCFTGNCMNDSTVEDNYDPADVIRVIYAAVGSLGMTGNALVIIVIMSSLQMRRSTTNLMITNQSAIDFSASLFILLGTNIRDVDGIRSTIGRELFCRLWAPNILMWGLSVSSTYNLVCITMERYTGIVYPMRHSRTCSRGRAKYAMAFAWFIGLAFNMSYMIPTSPYSDGRCMPYTEWPSLTVQRAVGLLTISLQFFLPVLMIISAYIRIAISLHQNMAAESGSEGGDPKNVIRQNRMKRARMNVVKTLVIVVVSFLCCWTPNQIIYTMYNLGIQIDFNSPFIHFTVISVFLNCCINPFIYAFQYDQFKKELFRRCRRQRSRFDNISVTTDTNDQSVGKVKARNVYAITDLKANPPTAKSSGVDNPSFNVSDSSN